METASAWTAPPIDGAENNLPKMRELKQVEKKLEIFTDIKEQMIMPSNIEKYVIGNLNYNYKLYTQTDITSRFEVRDVLRNIQTSKEIIMKYLVLVNNNSNSLVYRDMALAIIYYFITDFMPNTSTSTYYDMAIQNIRRYGYTSERIEECKYNGYEAIMNSNNQFIIKTTSKTHETKEDELVELVKNTKKEAERMARARIQNDKIYKISSPDQLKILSQHNEKFDDKETNKNTKPKTVNKEKEKVNRNTPQKEVISELLLSESRSKLKLAIAGYVNLERSLKASMNYIQTEKYKEDIRRKRARRPDNYIDVNDLDKREFLYNMSSGIDPEEEINDIINTNNCLLKEIERHVKNDMLNISDFTVEEGFVEIPDRITTNDLEIDFCSSILLNDGSSLLDYLLSSSSSNLFTDDDIKF